MASNDETCARCNLGRVAFVAARAGAAVFQSKSPATLSSDSNKVSASECRAEHPTEKDGDYRSG